MKPLKERFFKKVQKTDTCWLWMAAKSGGYGQIGYARKLIKAHRVSWEIFRGKIKNNLCVLHKCDNPSCVNPDHLFLGTQKDNAIDRSKKNRGGNLKGIANGRSKLNHNQVIAIRKRVESNSSVAKEFGISPSQVSKIRKRKEWKHI